MITIDDKLPYCTERKMFLFARVNNGMIWPALLEKAFAKLNRCYENIIAGLPNGPLTFIFPCNFSRVPVSFNADKLFERLSQVCNSETRGALVSSKMNKDLGKNGVDISKVEGISKNHTYVIERTAVCENK